MKAGIAIDAWKLEIFEHHLKRAGIAYRNAGPLTPDSLLLSVETNDPVALQKVVTKANTEAALSRRTP